jgi:hypothetical protein
VRRARTTPLWIALALSVLAHAVMLGGRWLTLPQDAPDPLPLSARLQPLPPEPLAPSPKPVVKAQPRTTPKAAPRVVVAPATTQGDAPRVWEPALQSTLANDTDEASDTAAQPDIAPAPPARPVVVATAAPISNTFLPEPAQIRTLPRRGRIEYKFLIYLNGLSTDIARTVQTWEASVNTYRIDSKSQTVGLARLAPIGAHEYQSSGLVTEHGLQPQRYTSKEERRGHVNESAAQFDSPAARIL